MADTNLDKLKTLLAELFMLDQADLDFGIYRVMNAKRVEVTRFLDHDLLPQVRATLATVDTGDRAALEAEKAKAIAAAQGVGLSREQAEQTPKVRELQAKLDAHANPADLENEVLSDLANFFRRYYSGGDFLALRRYKAGVYAIPYEGEEVKLHWANADQYYIKTSEFLRDYTFKLADGKRIHFKLVEADTEADNKKSAAGQERRFILCAADPLLETDGELVIRFEYRPDADKRKQAELNKLTSETILNVPGFAAWKAALARIADPQKNPDRTVLEKHLGDYTARNSFDYFIHKDIGGFLRRELDFYIKNEIMHLDDIEAEDAPRVGQYLAKIKAIRAIARKIIDFLEQLENFQKKLWLKKKFVVETNYCVTLDRVAESLYPEIAANDAQRAEWVKLFAIDEIKASTPAPVAKQGELISVQKNKRKPQAAAYSIPLTIDFLKANQTLVLDTRFFPAEFKEKLLADNKILGGAATLDDATDGLLIHSENFQALNLLQARYREQVKCIYIDPPYNTASSSIPYKNDYKHSSWVTMMYDRLALLRPLIRTDGAIFVSIDKAERTVLEHALDSVFGQDNRVEELIWSMNTNNSQAPNYSTNHEYVQVYAKDRGTAENDPAMFREPKPGYEEVMALIAELKPSYPPVSVIESELRKLYDRHRLEYQQEIEAQGLEWEDEKSNDSWKGLFSYSRAEYRDANANLVSESDAKNTQAEIWIWQEGDASMPATKQAESTGDPNSPNWRFYKPAHPVNGKPCPHPKSGWKFAYADDMDSPDKRSFVSLDRDGRIAWGIDENKVPRLKRMLHEVETNVGKSVFQDYSDGEKQTSAMFGKSGIFLAPKHADFVSRFIIHAAKRDSTVFDCFGGSGSTGHAVIKLNREDRGKRKFTLIEVGNYFNTVLKPRIVKAIYSKDWRGGKPLSREGISSCVKILRLESYEDALNNLELKRTEAQDDLLRQHAPLREDYLLRYQLDVESAGSASLLAVAQFANPFAYQLKIATGSVGESRAVNVDLVETFNYLLGLRVSHTDTIRGFKVVNGLNPAGDKTLVIWRNVAEKSNKELDDFFKKQEYNTKDMEFAVIYVNGDNNLENLKRADETWKVRRIEDEFKRLMFDVQDV
jgi:adenine-specific DNA-methyltransferase